MTKKAYLVLIDGSVYEGESFGSETDSSGEVVFNTSMIGYQEILTDPSYAGQIVLPTFPLIGNYGINTGDIESRKIQVRGFIVREECLKPNHYRSSVTLHEYLTELRNSGHKRCRYQSDHAQAPLSRGHDGHHYQQYDSGKSS